MMDYPFEFNIDKGIDAILYIIQNGAKPTLHHISKVMYFADKEHLQKYGRLIFGDHYVAMKHGPVPSEIYDILKVTRGDKLLSSTPNELVDKTKSSFSVQEKYKVNQLREANLDVFSESDLECLDHSIKKYGNLSFDELTDLSHDEAWEATTENELIEIEYILSTLDNADELIDHLQDQYPGEA